jgi:membrane protein DedA with SNARE-associated domain
MTDRFHAGTLLWGVILTLAGAALAAIGFGWWEISSIDLRYVGPALVILIGFTILTGALLSGNRARARTDETK